MAIFDFLNDPRRRLLAERGLIGGDDSSIAAPATNPPPPRLPSPVLPPWEHLGYGEGSAAPTAPISMPGLPERRDSNLPDVMDYRPVSAARPELDMTGAPSIIPKPQTRYGELQEAKDVYLQKTPGRLKSGLLGALGGAL